MARNKLFKIRLPQFRLRTRLILSFLVPILAIVFIGVFSYFLSKNEIKRVVIESSQKGVSGEVAYFNLLVNIIESQSMQLLTHSDMQKAFKPGLKDTDITEQIENKKRIESLLSSLTASNQYVKSYSIIGTNNCIYTDSKLSIRTLDELKTIPSFDPFISGKVKSAWIGDKAALSSLYGSTPSQGASLAYVMQYNDIHTGKLLGLMIIEIDPKIVETMSDRMNAVEGVSHIISQDGFDNVVSAKQGLTDLETAYAFSKTTDYQEFISGSEAFRIKEGKENILIIEKSGNKAVVFGIEIPRTTLYAAVNRILVISLMVVAIAVILSLFIAFNLSARLSSSIKRVVTAAKEAASGNLNQELSSEGSDEIGVLINSMGAMMKSMRQLILTASEIAESVFESAAGVNTTSEQVVRVTDDIATAVSEISLGANAQAQDAESGVMKSNLLALSIKAVAMNTEQIQQESHMTFSLTKNALSSIRELDEKAGQTNRIVQEVRDDIGELSKRSQKIAGIVKGISNVAEQTRLLSLNASIEAARAGALGRGFAVVAEEVHHLAEQTAVLVRDITRIVKENEHKMEETVRKADSTQDIVTEQNNALEKAIQSFNEISHSMEKLVESVQAIKNSTDDMNQHKDQVLNSIQNISAVSEETAAATQEVTAATEQQRGEMSAFRLRADQLEQEAQRLKNAIRVFRV